MLSAQQLQSIDKYLKSWSPTGDLKKEAKTYTLYVNTTSPSASRAQRQKILKDLSVDLNKASTLKGVKVVYETDTSGKITLGDKDILIYAKDKAKSLKPSFLPKDVKPSIVNVWLEPADMVKNVVGYLKTIDITPEERRAITELVELTASDTRTNYSLPKFNTKLVPSEFYEILSSIKLAILLRANDKKIKTVMGIEPRKDLRQVKLKIFIPKSATTPLVDYYVSLSTKPDEENSYKISVKSKVSSAKANTVKFADMFDKSKDVDTWYKELPSAKDRVAQVGPKAIASAIMDSYARNDRKTAVRASMASVINLIKVDRKHIEGVLNAKFGVRSISTFADVLTKIDSKLLNLNNKDSLGTILTKKEYDFIWTFIKNNLMGVKDLTDNIIPLAYICDKILIESSKKQANLYNFYQMFHDEVLKRRHVAYAVSDFKAGTLSYNFYSMENWEQEYHAWIALRGQNSTKEINGVIGLDV